MKITPAKYAQTLVQLLSGSNDPRKTVKDFLAYLQTKKGTKMLAKILRVFEEEWNKEHDILHLRVSAPKKFEASAKRLSDALKKKTGHPVQCKFHPDDSLIGGLKVRYDHTLLDASVKHRLQLLRSSLSNTSTK